MHLNAELVRLVLLYFVGIVVVGLLTLWLLVSTRRRQERNATRARLKRMAGK